MPTSACHAPFRQFGKRFAVKLGDFERSLIDTSLTYDELKSAFHMMDKNNGKCGSKQGSSDVAMLSKIRG